MDDVSDESDISERERLRAFRAGYHAAIAARETPWAKAVHPNAFHAGFMSGVAAAYSSLFDGPEMTL